ncbi:MAG: hypothetical protein V3T70_10550, partial [Phycisphaerae bacterium]
MKSSKRVHVRGAMAVMLAVGMLAPFAAADSVTLVTVKDNTMYEDVTGSISNGAGLHFFAGLK